MKENVESKISKIFTAILKEVGGRGAKNILVKDNNDYVEICFILNKSHIEEFIYRYFSDSDTYLKDLNNRIAEIVSKMIKNKLEEVLEMNINSYSYEIDIYTDKYSMKFNKKNSLYLKNTLDKLEI